MHKIKWVGRGNDRNPLKWFIEDVNSGNWRDFCYECNVGKEKPNENWFRIEEFLLAVESQ